MSIVTQRIYTGDSIVYVGENGGGTGGGLSAVVHDATLTGDGTADDPLTLVPASTTLLGGIKVGSNLSVTSDGTLNGEQPGISSVSHDSTLTGNGTSASSLSAVLGLWPTISFTSGSLAIRHGIFYIGTDIANLTLSLNQHTAGAEYHLKFTTSSTIGTFDFSAVTSWIGNSPSISASTTYEMDILDGVGTIATVG